MCLVGSRAGTWCGFNSRCAWSGKKPGVVAGTRTWSGANIRTDSYSGFGPYPPVETETQHDPVLVPGVDSTLDEPGVVAGWNLELIQHWMNLGRA